MPYKVQVQAKSKGVNVHPDFCVLFGYENERYKKSAEYRLMTAVLDRALKDLHLGLTQSRNTAGTITYEKRMLKNWFLSENYSHLFSYRSVCEYLEINSDELLAELVERGLLKADG